MAVGCSCCWARATGTFGAATAYPAEANVELAIGDFTDDGNQDVAATCVVGGHDRS